MRFSASELEDAKFYVTFGCPDLIGTPVFELSQHSDVDEPVTHLGNSEPTDFTRDEYARLERGEKTLEKIGRMLSGVLEDYPSAPDYSEFFDKLGFIVSTASK